MNANHLSAGVDERLLGIYFGAFVRSGLLEWVVEVE